ncbi:hypothetical protein C8R47DRAFT_145914 [Mycena vitilis]|nr:hypothetical protein C8R47DRAFT_145914 [Mycena vitilis]
MHPTLFLSFSLPFLTAFASPTPPSGRHAAIAANRPAPRATGTLPDPATFKNVNGTQWSIKYIGDLAFTDTLQAKGLAGDKCRSSVLGSKVIWNCGDMQCGDSFINCGFSMVRTHYADAIKSKPLQGAAFYGTSSVMTVDTTGIALVQDNNFAAAGSDDAQPVSPQTAFGMDTSNIAAINSTHGVAYAWEIWRGASDGSFVDRGNAVVSVTLGDTKPIATRVGPLLTDANAVQLGLLAILRDGDFIYTYSIGGPSGILVGRVAASDAVFTASAYEFLVAGSTTDWNTPPSIPNAATTAYGMTTANPGGKFSCSVYGSVFFNAYLNQYVMICTAFENFTNMYVSPTPFGPWSAEYGLLSGWGLGYGSMAHPEFSTNGGQTFQFSQGPDGPFNMFEVSFIF